MKKLILMLVLTLTLTFTLSIKTTYALETETLYYEDNWNAYNVAGDIWAMRIYETDLPDFKSLSITIPASSDNVNSKTEVPFGTIFSHILLSDGTNTLTIKTDDLISAGMLTNIVSGGTIILDGKANTDLSIDIYEYDWTTLEIRIVQYPDYDGGSGVPGGYVAMYQADAIVALTTNVELTVLYYDRFNLVETQYIRNNLFEATDYVPTPPSNYVFVGWMTINDVIIDFNYLFYIDDNWINSDNEIRLQAYFRTDTPGFYDGIDTTDTAPDEFGTILDAFGFDTVGGRMIVYVFAVILLLIGITLLNAPLILHFMTILGITILFVVMGWMPVYIAILLFMLFTLVLLNLNRNGGVVSE